MDKKYLWIEPSKTQIIIMRKGWKLFQEKQDKFYKETYTIEKEMSKNTGIDDLEFFFCDNECAGIGDVGRKMRLIQRKDLE